MDMADKDLDFAFDLNVRAMIRTIRAVLPAMLERDYLLYSVQQLLK